MTFLLSVMKDQRVALSTNENGYHRLNLIIGKMSGTAEIYLIILLMDRLSH